MNVLTKIGAFLGTVAFVLLATAAGHVYYETNNVSKTVPTLEQMQANTVEIITSDGICSGWVHNGKVLTAAHCFSSVGEQALVLFYGTDKPVSFTVDALGDSSGPLVHDLATLVPQDKNTKMPKGLDVCTTKPYYGEPVVVFGNPLGVDWLMQFGRVANPDFSSFIRDDLKNGEHEIVLDTQIWPGNSGGAVVDTDQGCVIGQSEAIILATPGTSGAGVAVVTPVKE